MSGDLIAVGVRKRLEDAMRAQHAELAADSGGTAASFLFLGRESE
jgi:hypothetical protein